jgi:hypothetical protein
MVGGPVIGYLRDDEGHKDARQHSQHDLENLAFTLGDAGRQKNRGERNFQAAVRKAARHSKAGTVHLRHRKIESGLSRDPRRGIVLGAESPEMQSTDAYDRTEGL